MKFLIELYVGEVYSGLVLERECYIQELKNEGKSIHVIESLGYREVIYRHHLPNLIDCETEMQMSKT